MSLARLDWLPLPMTMVGHLYSIPLVIISLLITLQVFRSLLSRWSPSLFTITKHSIAAHCSCQLCLQATLHPKSPLLYSLSLSQSSLPTYFPPLEELQELHQRVQTPKSQQTSYQSLHLYTVDFVWSCFLLLMVALLFVPIKAAIRPNCRCIIFDDTFGKEYGIFTSPEWPIP